MHSVTKYLAGHSDVILGATVTADTEAGRAAHERLPAPPAVHGAIAGPMEVWLALRGLRTLHLRVERASANAAELARRLAGHPAVERVRYPGLGRDRRDRGAPAASRPPSGSPRRPGCGCTRRAWVASSR